MNKLVTSGWRGGLALVKTKSIALLKSESENINIKAYKARYTMKNTIGTQVIGQ